MLPCEINSMQLSVKMWNHYKFLVFRWLVWICPLWQTVIKPSVFMQRSGWLLLFKSFFIRAETPPSFRDVSISLFAEQSALRIHLLCLRSSVPPFDFMGDKVICVFKARCAVSGKVQMMNPNNIDHRSLLWHHPLFAGVGDWNPFHWSVRTLKQTELRAIDFEFTVRTKSFEKSGGDGRKNILKHVTKKIQNEIFEEMCMQREAVIRP